MNQLPSKPSKQQRLKNFLREHKGAIITATITGTLAILGAKILWELLAWFLRDVVCTVMTYIWAWIVALAKLAVSPISIPSLLLIIPYVVVFIVLLFLWLRYRKMRFLNPAKNDLQDSSPSPLIGIVFGYAPNPPTEGHWALGEKEPTYKSIDDEERGRYLHIVPAGRYNLDYKLHPSLINIKRVRFVVKQDCPGVKYVRVEGGTNGPGSKPEYGYLLLKDSGSSEPRQDKRNPNEWVVSVPQRDLGNGWSEQVIDVEKEFGRTFATNGWTFERVHEIRLRKEIKILSIDLLNK